ncbi:MAG: hypothetical protein EXR76_18005 [Myxococcales bacterium]|nr:hypothetical protein [Myxococcales bacterium]
MAGLFRKLASAFVEFDDPVEGAPSGVSDAGIEAELAGLETQATALMHEADVIAPTPLVATVLPAETLQVLSQTVDQVVTAAGIRDGIGSASRVLKMLVGLAQFPGPQQLAMLRALDAADDTWSEADVAADAEARRAALDVHLKRVEQARTLRVADLDVRHSRAQEARIRRLEEIDQDTALLMKQREVAITTCAEEAAAVERERRELELLVEQARSRMREGSTQLASLLGFFNGGPPPR